MTTSLAEAPSVDADAAIAIDTAVSMSGVEVPTTRTIYVLDGDYGVLISANLESPNFDLDTLTQAAVEQVRAAQG